MPENGGEGRAEGGGIGGRDSELIGDFRKGVGGVGFEGVVEQVDGLEGTDEERPRFPSTDEGGG